MAFKLELYLGTEALLTRSYPVVSHEVVYHGDAIKLVNGRVRHAHTNEPVLGVSNTRAATTGNPTGTETVEVILATDSNGAVFETEQAGKADADVQPGDQVDLNPQGDGITADANHDCVVWMHDATRDLVYVKFENTEY